MGLPGCSNGILVGVEQAKHNGNAVDHLLCCLLGLGNNTVVTFGRLKTLESRASIEQDHHIP